MVNARDVKNVPGRPKTDKLDAVWLARLAERGMLRASFIPPRPQRQLRDLTRYRHLCRHRHSIRYAEIRIMPSSRAACRLQVVAGVKIPA